MKKFIAILMAAALIMSLNISALAVYETVDATESESITGAYTAGGGGDTIYYITIEWDNSNYSYVDGNTYTWQGETMQYTSDSGTITETAAAVSVTVTNQSNTAVSAEVTYTDADDDITTTISWDDDTSSATLDSAAVTSEGTEIEYTNTTDTGTAQAATFSGDITISNPEDLSSTATTIGTVTVTVSAASSGTEE